MTPLQQLPTPLLAWYDKEHRSLPWRDEVSPYRTWVSEIMLQQTRVAAVIPYFTRFMETFPTVEALANAEEPQLMTLWQGLGYYSRARNLHKAAKEIAELHEGKFPNTYAKIRTLSGVGEYTAGAIASIAFGEAVPAVDGNVLRVVARLTDDEENILLPAVRRRVTEALTTTIPHDRPGDFNQAMMELGATVCLPNRSPKCSECPCRTICLAHARGRTEVLPVRIKPQGKRRERYTVFILQQDGFVAVRQRNASGLLAGLWEFPNIEGALTEEQAAAQLNEWGLSPHKWLKKEEKKHIFTHIVWEMTVYTIETTGNGHPDWHWRSRDNADKYPMPTAFSKLRKN